jgi:hypothetical protein
MVSKDQSSGGRVGSVRGREPRRATASRIDAVPRGSGTDGIDGDGRGVVRQAIVGMMPPSARIAAPLVTAASGLAR